MFPTIRLYLTFLTAFTLLGENENAYSDENPTINSRTSKIGEYPFCKLVAEFDVEKRNDSSPIDTAFVMPWNSLSDNEFELGLRRMPAFGFKRIIVQTLWYCEDERKPPVEINPNRISQILSTAKENDIKVYLGLAMIGNFQGKAANGSIEIAKQDTFRKYLYEQTSKSWDQLITRGYAKHSSFSGVYLPQELWTPGNESDLGCLIEYITDWSRKARLQNLEVVISPFLSESASDPSLTKSIFSKIAGQHGVSWLIPQDSVAVRLSAWNGNIARQDQEYTRRLLPYLKAFQEVAKDSCSEFGINIESFTSHAASGSAEWSRVQMQIARAKQMGVPSIGTYEYFSNWVEGSLPKNYLGKNVP